MTAAARAPAPLRTTTIWGDTIRHAICAEPSCRRRVWFAVNVKTGNPMIFDGEPLDARISVQPELGTGREAWLVNLTAAHWGRCPGAAEFRRPR